MASSKQAVLLLAVIAAVACLASPASATQWMVGDEGGWRAKFNETGWTDGKTFVVGDSLMFMYPTEKHTVARVSKDDFAACNLQGNLLGLWTSGNDVVPLDEPGKAWFICTKPNHCLNGMKLVVDVVSGDNSATPAPSPLPWPFPFPFPGVPASPPRSSPSQAAAPASRGVPATAASPSFLSPRQSPFPFWGPVPAPSPWQVPSPWWNPATPASPPAAPPSAAVRYPVGGAVAAAAAAVLAAVLVF